MNIVASRVCIKTLHQSGFLTIHCSSEPLSQNYLVSYAFVFHTLMTNNRISLFAKQTLLKPLGMQRGNWKKFKLNALSYEQSVEETSLYVNCP